MSIVPAVVSATPATLSATPAVLANDDTDVPRVLTLAGTTQIVEDSNVGTSNHKNYMLAIPLRAFRAKYFLYYFFSIDGTRMIPPRLCDTIYKYMRAKSPPNP